MSSNDLGSDTQETETHEDPGAAIQGELMDSAPVGEVIEVARDLGMKFVQKHGVVGSAVIVGATALFGIGAAKVVEKIAENKAK